MNLTPSPSKSSQSHWGLLFLGVGWAGLLGGLDRNAGVRGVRGCVLKPSHQPKGWMGFSTEGERRRRPAPDTAFSLGLGGADWPRVAASLEEVAKLK